MTRYLIAREGTELIVPNYFEPGSLVWDEKPIIVVYQANWSDPESILGMATDLERSVTDITAEIEWTTPKGQFTKGNINKDFFLTVYCDNVEAADAGDGLNVVRHARIKGLFTTIGDPWEEKR